MCEPISQPASASCSSSAQDIGTSSSACSVLRQWSMPGQAIGSSVPTKAVGANTVALNPAREMIGKASSITER